MNIHCKLDKNDNIHEEIDFLKVHDQGIMFFDKDELAIKKEVLLKKLFFLKKTCILFYFI